jgi:hypothetical protein
MARLVFVTGDKGGVGKSFTSRALLDWYLESGISVQAFDTDKTNSTLFRFFQKMDHEGLTLEQIDTDNQSALDELLERLATAKKEDVIMLDCAARTMDKLLLWMKEVDFFSLALDLNIQITLAFVLGPEKDCVAILKDIAEEFQGNVSYVLIKNLGRGAEFKVYDQSKSRDRILNEFSGFEIEIPALMAKTSLEVDRLNLPFIVAKEDTALMIADRQRVTTFRSKLFHSFERVRGLWI